MFTDVDVRNIAIQIERNGEETYRRASENAVDEDVAEMLLWMADEEMRHCKWFEALELKERTKTPEQIEMEALGRNLLQDMVKSRTFSLEQHALSAADQLSTVLAQCKTFESDTILFYEFLKGFIDDDEAARQLDLIIDEERGHLRQLEQLLETVS